MKKCLILGMLIFIAFSCSNNDEIDNYYISVINNSSSVIYDIDIKMNSLDTGHPDSLRIDSLIVGEVSEKLNFKFCREAKNGCSGGTAATMACCFQVNYSQNDSLTSFSQNMESKETNDITVDVLDEEYIIIDN